jgi:UrcA family protein
MDAMKVQGSSTFAALAAAVMLTSAGLPSLAQAFVQDDVRSETVRFDDLNLGTTAGLQALYVRIQNAARDVCGQADLPGSRVASAAWKDCVSDSVHQAILKVNNPSLTAYYADRLRAPMFTTKGRLIV